MLHKGPIPAAVHGTIEYLAGVLFIAASFLFGFSEDGKATAFFIALGVAHLLITIATRVVRTDAAAT